MSELSGLALLAITPKMKMEFAAPPRSSTFSQQKDWPARQGCQAKAIAFRDKT